MNLPEDDMSATDILRFDVKAAELTYLLNKKKRGEPLQQIPRVTVSKPTPDDSDLPAFLRRQAD
jgi:hypothetical protein